MRPVFVLIVACVLLGCSNGGYKSSGGSGGSGGGGGNPSPQYLQAGQWEFTFPLTGNPSIAFMETNLQVSNTNISATASAIAGYSPYFSASVPPSQWGSVIGGPFPNGYILCPDPAGDSFSGSTSSGFSASVTSSSGLDYADLKAQLQSGSTISSLSGTWSYSGTSSDYAPWTCENGSNTSGSFTATYISPVNGTFSGTLQTSSGTDVVTVNLTQSGYNISVSGTASGSTVTVTQASVIGALVYGTGTSTSVNSPTFKFGAHIHPDGRSIDIVIIDSNGTAEWGLLTHN